MSIIYKITNKNNGKSYIGQTIRSLKWRWKKHFDERNRHDHHFSRALRIYPKNQWIVEVLEETSDKSLLNEREIYWISYYDTYENGYNSTIGGHEATRPKGFHLSEEHKKKLSLAKLGKSSWSKGKKFTEEHKKKLSAARLGKEPWNKGKSGEYKLGPCSEDKKEKIRIAQLGEKNHSYGKEPWNKGVPCSEETKKKLSEAKKGLIPWNKGKIPSIEEKKQRRRRYYLKQKAINNSKIHQEGIIA